jgi:hypothetical protein
VKKARRARPLPFARSPAHFRACADVRTSPHPLSPSLLAGAATAAVLLALCGTLGLDLPVSSRLCAGAGAGLSVAHALRDWLRYVSEASVYARERAREAWELENFPEGERREMIELYTTGGVSEADAVAAVSALSRYPHVFVELMMAQELKLQAPDETPLRTAGATLAGFLLFFAGLAAPLLGFLQAAGGLPPSRLLDVTGGGDGGGDGGVNGVDVAVRLVASMPPLAATLLALLVTFAGYWLARRTSLPLHRGKGWTHVAVGPACVAAAVAGVVAAAGLPASWSSGGVIT